MTTSTEVKHKVNGSWTPRPGDRMVRIPRRADVEGITFSTRNGRRTRRRGLSPPLMVSCVFVGLSSGATSQLSMLGQCVLMLTMLVGRLGPLTIGLAMAQGPEVEQYRLPKEYVATA